VNTYRKLIIIGAPRSGTNMLRDALCALPGFATWDCDEINPIWKHGHLHSHPHDDLPPTLANPAARAFVRTRFDRLAHATGAQVVVEKTCANSVRVGYLRALLPEAEFIFIRRHGADAVASAITRWRSSLPLRYSLKKARYVPLQDIPFYAARALLNRLRQAVDPGHRLRAWGPMTESIATAARCGDVVRAAALQWQECVVRSLAELPETRVEVRYEDFVREPQVELRSILSAVRSPKPEAAIVGATRAVRAGLAGQGAQRLLAHGQLPIVAPIINPVLERLGYAPV